MDDEFEAMLSETDRFFAGTSKVHVALDRVVRALTAAQVEFALGGDLAIGEHGYVHVTGGIELVVTAKGLAQFKAQCVRHGFVEKSPDARGGSRIRSPLARSRAACASSICAR